MGTNAQQFCLKWNNHQANMLSVFDRLLSNKSLVDVTIGCEGRQVKAHKVVLSACSPFFENLFTENPCKHPIVILKDIRYADLKALVEFMYKGEVNVVQEQLPTLLKTAEALKIKGLAEVTGEGKSEDKPHASVTPRPESPGSRRKRQRVRRKSTDSVGGHSDSEESVPKASRTEHDDSSMDGATSLDDGSQASLQHSQTPSQASGQARGEKETSNVQNNAATVNNSSSSAPANNANSTTNGPNSSSKDADFEPTRLLEASMTTDHGTDNSTDMNNSTGPDNPLIPDGLDIKPIITLEEGATPAGSIVPASVASSLPTGTDAISSLFPQGTGVTALPGTSYQASPQSHVAELRCEFCTYTATSTDDLKAHVEIHGPAPASVDDESSQDESVPPSPPAAVIRQSKTVKDRGLMSSKLAAAGAEGNRTSLLPVDSCSLGHSTTVGAGTDRLESVLSSHNIPTKYSTPQRVNFMSSASVRSGEEASTASRHLITSGRVVRGSPGLELRHPAAAITLPEDGVNNPTGGSSGSRSNSSIQQRQRQASLTGAATIGGGAQTQSQAVFSSNNDAGSSSGCSSDRSNGARYRGVGTAAAPTSVVVGGRCGDGGGGGGSGGGSSPSATVGYVTSKQQLPKASPFSCMTPSREPFADDEDNEEWMVRWSKPAPASVKKARLLFNRYRNMRSPIKTRRSTLPTKAPVYQRLVLHLPSAHDDGQEMSQNAEAAITNHELCPSPAAIAADGGDQLPSTSSQAAVPTMRAPLSPPRASTTTSTVAMSDEAANSSSGSSGGGGGGPTLTIASYRTRSGSMPKTDGGEVTSPKLVIRTTFGNNTVASSTTVSTAPEPDSSAAAAAPKVKFKIRPPRGREANDTADTATNDTVSSVSHNSSSNKKDNTTTKRDTGEPVVKMHLYHCTHCKKFFSKSESLKEHLRLHHKRRKGSSNSAGGGISSNNGHQGK